MYLKNVNYFAVFAAIVLFVSCSKQSDYDSIQGVWVASYIESNGKIESKEIIFNFMKP